MADTWTMLSGYTASNYVDTMVFEVVSATKKIRPLSGQTLVAGEKNSQYVRFEMDRFWDGIDISAKNFSITYSLAGKYYGTSEAVSAEVSTDKLRFGWIVPEEACCIAGTLMFVLVIKSDGYVLKTQIAETPVVKSLDEESVVPEPTREAWYKEFQARVQADLDASQAALTSAQDALTRANTANDAASSALTAASEANLAAQDAIEVAKIRYGSPLVANAGPEMVETNRVYVFTGSESAYAYGHWYYYDNGVWNDGGVYNGNSVNTDKTLSIENMPADAKKTGDEISELKEGLTDIYLTTSDSIGKALSPKTVSGGKVTEWQFKSFSGGGGGGSSDYTDLDNKPKINGVTVNGNQTSADLRLQSNVEQICVDDFGAVGDGTTDDSQAVQDAIDAGYDVYFSSNKTYYLGSAVNITEDKYLHGGENTVIKTKTPSGGATNNGFVASGTLKKTTTLTTDYSSVGTTDNSCNRFTLSDMSGINIGDIMVITATDQHYHYARPYYYLGGTLLITDIYDGHIYTSDTLPWDIENTNDVSVTIYNAPSVIFENLHFVSDLDSIGSYSYLIAISKCKNSVIRQCSFSQMASGVKLAYCVNTSVDTVSLSKSKYDNSMSGDAYGIVVWSCTNTIIQKIIAMCAQHAITISGNEPSLNTYVKNCDLTSECRSLGLDTHESTYNLVIEDCVLGTAAFNGTVYMNRCKIINNRRVSGSEMLLSIYGSHNPDWAKFYITNCVFDGTGLYIIQSFVQNPIQAYNNVYGSIEIENCVGGRIVYEPSTNTTILSNTIKKLSIKKWDHCSHIRFDGLNKIEKLEIADSTFTNPLFITDGTASHGIILNNIENFDYKNILPLTHKITIDKDTSGENLLLPKNVSIHLSSNNNSAKFVVCGRNLVSNSLDDYVVGNVTGSDGGTLNRTQNATAQTWLSLNADGNLVYTMPSNSANSYAIYPVGMFYVKELSTVAISTKLKNAGATSGASFKACVAYVNAETKTLVKRDLSSAVQATAEGAIVSISKVVTKGRVVLLYLYCSSGVASSITTFEDYTVTCVPTFAPAPTTDEPYVAKRLTGDGIITSLEGINNIMSSELDFHVTLEADYVNGVSALPVGEGVSF